MYGPPPDPRQHTAPVLMLEHPEPYLICAVIGLLITALALWRRGPEQLRAAAFILGQTVLLTMPLAVLLNRYWYGSFPTIDKEGSLLFYLDGVHIRMLLHPLASLSDPAARLIGVHTGHLWPVSLFDLVLSPMGAFNLMALLSPALGWYAAWLLLRDVSGAPRVSMVLSFAFGMGLHIFRDLNWYTIEKAAVFWLALYLWALHRAWRDGGRWIWWSAGIFALMCWMNLYLGMVGGVVAGLGAVTELVQRRVGPLTRAALLSVLFASPLLVWQMLLMRDGPQLATPEQFLWQRAALDSVSLIPPRWNRLELHRATNLVGLGLALFGAVRHRRDPRVQFAVLAATVLFALSLGPVVIDTVKFKVQNPLYLALFHVVPGFWRIAKPEVFFHGTWLLLLAIATIELGALASRRGLLILYLIFVGAWVVMVRSHPAYPGMSKPVDSKLAPDWQERVFQR